MKHGVSPILFWCLLTTQIGFANQTHVAPLVCVSYLEVLNSDAQSSSGKNAGETYLQIVSSLIEQGALNSEHLRLLMASDLKTNPAELPILSLPESEKFVLHKMFSRLLPKLAGFNSSQITKIKSKLANRGGDKSKLEKDRAVVYEEKKKIWARFLIKKDFLHSDVRADWKFVTTGKGEHLFEDDGFDKGKLFHNIMGDSSISLGRYSVEKPHQALLEMSNGKTYFAANDVVSGLNLVNLETRQKEINLLPRKLTSITGNERQESSHYDVVPFEMADGSPAIVAWSKHEHPNVFMTDVNKNMLRPPIYVYGQFFASYKRLLDGKVYGARVVDSSLVITEALNNKVLIQIPLPDKLDKDFDLEVDFELDKKGEIYLTVLANTFRRIYVRRANQVSLLYGFPDNFNHRWKSNRKVLSNNGRFTKFYLTPQGNVYFLYRDEEGIYRLGLKNDLSIELLSEDKRSQLKFVKTVDIFEGHDTLVIIQGSESKFFDLEDEKTTLFHEMDGAINGIFVDHGRLLAVDGRDLIQIFGSLPEKKVTP